MEENRSIIISDSEIQTYIFEARGRKVMLDYHIAKLYQVETRTLKQAVRRNINRFPNDFMFRLTKEETNTLISIGVSQSVIPTGYNPGGSDVFAFTEEGVSMLSAVLKSEIAIRMSIAIIRVFISLKNAMTNILNTNLKYEQLANEIKELRLEMNEILTDQNDINESIRRKQDSMSAQLDALNDALANMQAEETQKKLNAQRNPIGFMK